jgi:hypothetical protein
MPKGPGQAPPESGDQWIDNRSRKAQDEAFCDALDRAWRLGLERPPMIGVDTRPGTRNPMMVVPPSSSIKQMPLEPI